MDEEGSKGWNLPQPSIANYLFDIHLKDISFYSSTILEVTSHFTSTSKLNLNSHEFLNLFCELLVEHNAKTKNYYNSMITQMFDHAGEDRVKQMVEHFSLQADKETKLRCKELLSSLKIKNSSICSDITLLQWAQPEKKSTEIHTFTEEYKE